jgi:hypothetical protein
MMAMPSVSKNLKIMVRTLLSIAIQQLAPSPQTSAGTCKVFVIYDYDFAMGKDIP